MKPKYQIFVSSTIEDMKDERLAITQQILKKQHIPSMMEDFVSAAQKDIIELLEEHIDMCDIFLLVLGGRYGHIINGKTESFVEYEYDYAIRKGKPIIVVVIENDFLRMKKGKALDENKSYYEDDSANSYKQFVKKAKDTGKTVGFYSNMDILKDCISGGIDAIVDNPKKYPNLGPGWFRGTGDMGSHPMLDESLLDDKTGIVKINYGKGFNAILYERFKQAKDIKIIATSGKNLVESYANELDSALQNDCKLSILVPQTQSDAIDDLHELQRENTFTVRGFHDLNSEIKDLITNLTNKPAAKNRVTIGRYKTHFRANVLVFDNNYGFYQPTLPPCPSYSAVSFELKYVRDGLLDACLIHFRSIMEALERQGRIERI